MPIFPYRESPVWLGKAPAMVFPKASEPVKGFSRLVGFTLLTGPPVMLEPATPPLSLPLYARNQSTPVEVDLPSESWPKTVEIMT